MRLIRRLLSLVFLAASSSGTRGGSSGVTAPGGIGGQTAREDGVMRSASQGKYLLSPEQKEVLLHAHNYFRGRVTPQAANMVKLQWDDRLADMARAWSDRCIYGHGQDERYTAPYSWVGQNIWAGSGTGWDHYGMISDWYGEGESYDYDADSCSGDICGHYTQMVWAETSHVGCAMAECDVTKNLPWSPVTILVCNYGEGGNYPGSKPYISGPACSKCPLDLPACDDNGLCVAHDLNAGDESNRCSDTDTIAGEEMKCDQCGDEQGLRYYPDRFETWSTTTKLQHSDL